METVVEENLFILTLVASIKGRAGTVKLVAKNVAGDATSEANLTVAGVPPAFVEPPYISRVLDGWFIRAEFFVRVADVA